VCEEWLKEEQDEGLEQGEGVRHARTKELSCYAVVCVGLECERDEGVVIVSVMYVPPHTLTAIRKESPGKGCRKILDGKS
jgi:hypothetical protein